MYNALYMYFFMSAMTIIGLASTYVAIVIADKYLGIKVYVVNDA
jgi:hypothetical protein